MASADSADISTRIAELRQALAVVADPADVAPMAAYMKNQFAFLGVRAGPRRQAQRPTIASLNPRLRSGGRAVLLAFAEACWAQPEREFQYTACDALRKHAACLGAEDLPAIRRLIQAKSWWDTVDSLGPHTVGSLVAASPDLATEMDAWIDDPDIWVARAAILHQLMYAGHTDGERLFAYCDKRADDTEFFIRKALGWALRQYARVDPDAVRAYVKTNDDRLSGLTKREALKHLG